MHLIQNRFTSHVNEEKDWVFPLLRKRLIYNELNQLRQLLYKVWSEAPRRPQGAPALPVDSQVDDAIRKLLQSSAIVSPVAWNQSRIQLKGFSISSCHVILVKARFSWKYILGQEVLAEQL